MDETEIAVRFVASNIEEVAEKISKVQCDEHGGGEDGVVHLYSEDWTRMPYMCIPDNMYPENWPEDWPSYDPKQLMMYDFRTGETRAAAGHFYEKEIQSMAETFPRNIYFLKE